MYEVMDDDEPPRDPVTWAQVRKAQLFASERHGSQMHGARAYFAHLLEVATVLIDAGIADGALSCAAFLHDTVEDTETETGEIEDLFNEDIANLVWAVTGVGATRKERNQSIYDKIEMYPDAALIKCADRIANIEYTLTERNRRYARMYVEEHEAFTNVIRAKVPEHLWNRLERAIDGAALLLEDKE